LADGAAGVPVSAEEGAAGTAAAFAPELSAAVTFRFLRRFFCAFRAVTDGMDCGLTMRETVREEGAKASVLVDERAAAARAHRKRHEDTLGLVMLYKSIFVSAWEYGRIYFESFQTGNEGSTPDATCAVAFELV